MRKPLFAGAVLGVLSLVASPAFAQDAPADEPAFDGLYVGGSIGYSVQNNDTDETIRFDRDLNGSFDDTVVTSAAGAPNAFSPGFCNGRARGGTPAAGCDNDRDDLEYYGRVGFDKQFGNIVVGVVGEFGKSEIRDSVSAFSTTPASYTMTRELNWNAGLRARLGYAANTTLFYGTGGAAYGSIKNSFETTNGVNSFTDSGNDESWGWSAGGGVEQKLGRNFSFGLEYLYTKLTQDDYLVRAGAGSAPPTNPFLLAGAGGTDFQRSDKDFDFHGLRLTAAFRF